MKRYQTLPIIIICVIMVFVTVFGAFVSFTVTSNNTYGYIYCIYFIICCCMTIYNIRSRIKYVKENKL